MLEKQLEGVNVFIEKERGMSELLRQEMGGGIGGENDSEQTTRWTKEGLLDIREIETEEPKIDLVVKEAKSTSSANVFVEDEEDYASVMKRLALENLGKN